MRPDNTLLRVLAFFLAAVALAPANAAVTSGAAVDRIVDDAMARYRLPGIAVGVVENGQIVHVRTAGERVAGEGQPITRDTRFKIASNTKAMTAATLARLVDAGKLRWDDAVRRWLPDFRMHDAWVGEQMQVRDLLIHNSGLRAGAGDLMLWPEPNHFTRADIIHGLAYLKPQHSFRSRYDYDNLLYIVAGEVAAAAGGAPYDQLVRQQVFEPLGMRGCRVGEWRPQAGDRLAQPHVRQDGRNVPVRTDGELVRASTMDAAGGVRCGLDDMLAWVQAWLAPTGRAEAWLSKAQRDAVWAPQMPMPVSRRMREWDNSHFSAYGYGWRLSDVDGQFKVAHTGTLMGMYSAVTMLPDHGVGFVVLINGEAEDARAAVTQALTKLYTRPDPMLTVDHYARLVDAEQEARPASEKAPDTTSRRPLRADAWSKQLGVYRDPWFGEVTLCREQQAVRFRSVKSPQLSGIVQVVGKRTLVDWDDSSIDAEAWLEFAADGHLRMAKVDPQADFSYDYEDLDFTRVRDCD